MQEVVGKILLNQIAFASAADDELIDAGGVLNLQEMLKGCAAADLHHRLYLYMVFFGQERSKATGKNESFHSATDYL